MADSCKSGRCSGKVSVKLNWVSCDKCECWDLFENCKSELGLDEFDTDAIEKRSFHCRACRYEVKVENWIQVSEIKIDEALVRIKSLEDQLVNETGRRKKQHSEIKDSFITLEQNRVKIESEVDRFVALGDNKISEISQRSGEIEIKIDEIQSKVTITELRIDDESKKLSEQLGEISSRTTVLELKLGEFVEQWPTPGEADKKVSDKTSVDKLENKNTIKAKLSFQDKHRNKRSDTVVLIGDSLTRGIGTCLEKDSNMYSKLSFSGARIEDIQSKLSIVGDKPNSHVVVVVGTNNIKQDGSEAVISKFESLVAEVKKHSYRKVSVVGILKRNDLNSYTDSRRIGTNLRLKKLCEDNNIGYIYKDIVIRQLSTDGLHLNEQGQDVIAREIFSHCKQHLN